METITKETIVEMLKEKFGFSSLICEEITNTIFSEMVRLSLTEKKLLLTNFGKFQVYSKDKRPGTNLKTGESVEIPARKVLRFNASRSFKKILNSYE